MMTAKFLHGEIREKGGAYGGGARMGGGLFSFYSYRWVGLHHTGGTSGKLCKQFGGNEGFAVDFYRMNLKSVFRRIISILLIVAETSSCVFCL